MNKKEIIQVIRQNKLTMNLPEIQLELMTALSCVDQPKDILIVVKDQLDYLKRCISSIEKYTSNYRLYIWDNASKFETQEYLSTLNNACVFRSEENLGFIIPNNNLAAYTSSPYIILLNSDTEVKPNWDKAMLGWLQTHPDVAQVGYCGSQLDEEFKGGNVSFGYDIDYICGWAFCISREIYLKYGLFDKDNLTLAYCEDSDFSLRLKEQNHKIYALHLDLVEHFENKTILDLQKDDSCKKQFSKAFEQNHLYLKKRWSGKL